jgi:signal transduction histidine kinase
MPQVIGVRVGPFLNPWFDAMDPSSGRSLKSVRTRLRPTDVLVPAAITAVAVVELMMVRPESWGFAVVLETGAALLLVWRRYWPLVTSTAAAATLLLMPWVGPQLDQLAAPILTLALICYSLGRWIASLRGLVGIGLLLATSLIDYLTVDTRTHDFTDVVFVSALAIPPYVFGRISRKLALQSEQLARQQALIRDEAVRAERDRIARELHDVLAHSLSAMVVQTAAAQDLIRESPDRTAELLQSVADTGRKALEESGRLLHLIRDNIDELGLRPAPGLADIPALVETFRGNGLEVEAVLALPAEPLSGGVDVSAYRVVQELLTNALKYAGGAVRLSIDSAPDRLRISCANPVGPGRAVPGSGLGLQGITERVGLLGGTLDRRRADDRFVVEVDIPLAREATL